MFLLLIWLVVFMSGETCCSPSSSSFIVCVVVVLSVFAPFTCTNEWTNERSSRSWVSLSLTALRFYNSFTDSFTVVHYLQSIRCGVFLTPFAIRKVETIYACIFKMLVCFSLLCFALFIAHFNSLAIYQCRKSKASS